MKKILAPGAFIASLLFSSCSKDNPLPAGGTLSGVSTSSASGGDTVIITGTKFSTVLKDNNVTFGTDTTRARVLSSTATELKVIVPYLKEGSYDLKVQVKGFQPDKSIQFDIKNSIYSWSGYGGYYSYVYYRNNKSFTLNDCGQVSQIVGYGSNLYLLGANSTNKMKLWINGTAFDPIDLSKVNDAYAYCMALYGKDIYLGGVQQASINDTYDLGYWKNAVFNKLVDKAGNYAWVGDIKIINGDVHVVGSYRKSVSPFKSVIGYWENGVKMWSDSSSTTDLTPLKIRQVGNDIYTFVSSPFYYKNGVKVNLTLPSNFYLRSADTDGSNFYFIGNRPVNGVSVASLIKNGNETILSDMVNSAIGTCVVVTSDGVFSTINYNNTSGFYPSYLLKDNSNFYSFSEPNEPIGQFTIF